MAGLSAIFRTSLRWDGRMKPRYARPRPKGVKPRFGYRFRRRFKPRYPKPKRCP